MVVGAVMRTSCRYQSMCAHDENDAGPRRSRGSGGPWKLLCKYVRLEYGTVRFARLSVKSYGPKGPMGMLCEAVM